MISRTRKTMLPSPPANGDRWFWLGWLAVAVILCTPVWLTSIPPLSDYYNHLARLYILANHDAVPEYREFYDVVWALDPNLALDLVGLPLLSVFSLTVTAKLFLTLTILAWHAGSTLLARAILGRWGRRALVCSFFVYNQQFLHGYVNYMFGMGLGLCTLAFWIHARRRWSVWRVVAATVLACLVYLCHLAAFVTLAVAVAVMTLAVFLRDRRLRPALVAGVLPVLPGAGAMVADFLVRTRSGSAVFPGLAANLRDSMTLLTGYHPAVDLASMALVAALAALALAWRRGMGMRREVVAAGLALGAIFWLGPSDVQSGIEVNVRFLAGSIVLLILGVEIALDRRLRRWLLWAMLVLFTARTAVTAGYWMALDREFSAHLAAFEHIDRGATVHNVYFYPQPHLLGARRVEGLALIHSLCFAAVTRRANVPTLYANRGQQPLVHRRPLYRSHRYRQGKLPHIPWEREIFPAFDYVWACGAPAEVIAPLAARARVTARAGRCVLYETK